MSPRLVAVESTGGFETICAAALQGPGLPVVVVNPAQVRHFAKALAQRAKTDQIDARVIALFVVATQPKIRALPDDATRFLSDLVGRRRQIFEMIAAGRQREKHVTRERVKRSIRRLASVLERELNEVDADIDASMRGPPAWRESEDLLTSVKGVGPTVARTLLAVLPEPGKLDRRPIAALAGLAPYVQSSCRWRGKARISGGRDAVRATLFMAAQIYKRFNPDIKLFYDRLIANGKTTMVAAIAVALKLLTILNAILRDKKPWKTA